MMDSFPSADAEQRPDPTAPAKNLVSPSIPPPIPYNERERIAALRRFELLDTPAEPAFDQIVRLGARLLNVPIALVTLVDENRQWFKAKMGLDRYETSREDSFCAHAINYDDVFVIEDATRDPRFERNPLVTGDPQIRFYAGAPFRTREGYALGTVCVLDSQSHGALSADEKQTLRDLAALVMANIEARELVGFLSPVTALPNRDRFLADIDGFIADPARGTQQIAIVVVRTATSKEYADLVSTLGHTYADAFEVASVSRIHEILPRRVKLYHISPAHFSYVASADQDQVERLVLRLAEALREPIRCHEIPVTTTGGIGVAEYPENGDSGVELLRAATSALYCALDHRKVWSRYSAEYDRASQRRFRLLRDLPAALAAPNELHVCYQPKTDLTTRRCVGAEALLRWNHPELGPISPAEFIPLTERTSHMRPVTEWVIETVFRQISAWHEGGFELPISINISMLDLADEDFPESLATHLKRHGIRPEWIDIEITESALMRNQTFASHQLEAIRALGIEIEIDDFGTGQSALSYLKYIPASVVKIDQLFVRKLDVETKDQQMVRSTIALAHDLGFRVVAEGIETSAVHDWLLAHGCDFGQGFYMSRPLDPTVFRAWAAKANQER